MPLTDTTIKNAKPSQKTRKLFDAAGLYMELTPQGSKRWRFKYRFQNREKLLSLGIYPAVTLKDAREARDDARKLLSKGINPSDVRKAKKVAALDRQENSFKVVAREWLESRSDVWSIGHRKTIDQRLERNVFPFVGDRPISEITPPELLQLLRRIESREAHETAHRVRGIFGQIFRYAISTARIVSDPSRDLRGALIPVQKEHLASITDQKGFADLLRAIDSYQGSPIVMAALKLAPLVFVRPGELRHAEWKDIDLDTAEWRFVDSKTKSSHIVPLAEQSLMILREIKFITGSSRYVFPGARGFGRPMSNNAILAALRTLGVSKEQMCGHGFRASARTMLDEILKFPPHLIEHQLAHSVRDALGRAYNRTQHLSERKTMMQAWADFLDKLRTGQ